MGHCLRVLLRIIHIGPISDLWLFWVLWTDQLGRLSVHNLSFFGKGSLLSHYGQLCQLPTSTRITEILNRSSVSLFEKSEQLITFCDNFIHVYNIFWLPSLPYFYHLPIPINIPSVRVLFPNSWLWFCSMTHSLTKTIYVTDLTYLLVLSEDKTECNDFPSLSVSQ